jgi:hypothetical protein
MKTKVASSQSGKSGVRPYLTKRDTISVSKTAVLAASKRAMSIAGYVVIADGGWIVRQYKNGQVRKIIKYKTGKSSPLVLD